MNLEIQPLLNNRLALLWGIIISIYLASQVLRYNTGSAIRLKKQSAGRILEHHTWTASHGEALEGFPRKMHVQLCVTLPGKKLALSDFL